MENADFLTKGDAALWADAKDGHRSYGYGYESDCYHRRNGMAATGIGLAAGLGGGALLLAAAGIWGINQASKARARGAENLSNANAKTIELLAGVVASEKTRMNGVEIDVNQTLRNLTAASAQGGSASSLATAEAVAAILNGEGRNGQTCPTPVALYQPAMPCRCNTCGD